MYMYVPLMTPEVEYMYRISQGPFKFQLLYLLLVTQKSMDMVNYKEVQVPFYHPLQVRNKN